VDVFTEMSSAQTFVPATKRAVEMLREAGYDVEIGRDFPTYMSIGVSRGGRRLEVDFGLDYRGHHPVRTEIGPVLALDNAVGSRVSALYSPAATRGTSWMSTRSVRRDASPTGICCRPAKARIRVWTSVFSASFQDVHKIRLGEVVSYGITEEQLEGIKRRMGAWGEELSG
jgi:hypothetical protein